MWGYRLQDLERLPSTKVGFNGLVDGTFLVGPESAQDPFRIVQEGLEFRDGKVHAAVEVPCQVQVDFVTFHVKSAAKAHVRHDRFELGSHGNP